MATDPANPAGHIGGYTLYSTRCGHALYIGNTEENCLMVVHDFDHGPQTGPSVDTLTNVATRPATSQDREAIERGDACEQCDLSTDPTS